MKKIAFISLVLALILCIGLAAAEEAGSGILGKPFPDFTVTDTDGNTFTLSEALKDHEAVLINFWATWCSPCKNEFPLMNKVYQEYKNKVAFIALSKEKKDTLEKIGAFRQEQGLEFPMGRDEDQKLVSYVDSSESIPKTVIVDRYGNAVFFHGEAFKTESEIRTVLNAFLGDGYQETRVLTEIPADTSTRALPVSAKSAVYPLDSKYRKVNFFFDDMGVIQAGYIVPDASVTLRIEVGAEKNIANTVYLDEVLQASLAVESLYDPEKGIFIHEQGMQNSELKKNYIEVYLVDKTPGADLMKNEHIFLLPDEKTADEVVESIKQAGTNARWEYADEAAQQPEEPRAYIIHVVDQDNNPVEGAVVNFCTDAACTPQETDETGTITYTADPYKYHMQIVEVPDGYSWDESFDMYTTQEYGEWVLRIKKD
jgi:peroxiredoxin